MRRPDLRRAPFTLVALLLLVDQAAYILAPIQRAVAVSAALLAITISVLGGNPRPYKAAGRPLEATFLILVAAPALLLSFLNGNDFVLAVGDIYHWLVEFLLAAYVGVRVVAIGGPDAVVSALIRGFLLVGLAASILITHGLLFGGSLGGKEIADSSLWRLELGKLFPALPIVFLVAMFRLGGLHSGRDRLLARISLASMVLLLPLTFKRVQFLALLLGLLVVLAPRGYFRTRWFLTVVGSLALIPVVVAVGVGNGLGPESLSTLDYSSFSTTSSLETRLAQYGDLLPLLSSEPLGYGFGAEFDTRIDAGSGLIRSREHFVHSGYLFVGLQMGWMMLALLTVVLWQSCARWRREPLESWAWLDRACLAMSLMLVIASVSLVPFHSASVGLFLGMGFARKRFLDCEGERYDVQTRSREGLPRSAVFA